MLRAPTTPADRRLPSIRSIPALAAHLPPLPLSPTTSPASSYRTVTSTDDGSSSADDKMEALGVMAAEDKGEEAQVMCKPKVSSRLGRKLPNKACGPCKKLHTECGAERPCKTCVRRGRKHLCVDVPSKRGQKARQRNAVLGTAAPPSSRPTLTRSPPLLDLPPLPPLPTPPAAAFFKSPPVARPPLLRISTRFEPYPTSRRAHPLPPPSSGLSYSHSSPLPVVFASSYFQPPPSPFPARRFSLVPVPASTAASIASSASSSASIAASLSPHRPHLELLRRRSSVQHGSSVRTFVANCSTPQDRPLFARKSSGQIV